jgi:hypothetical protein
MSTADPRGGRRQQHLRATADSIAERAGRVVELEEEKQLLPDGDPGLVTRSREAEELIDEMARESRVELELVTGPDDGEDRALVH